MFSVRVQNYEFLATFANKTFLKTIMRKALYSLAVVSMVAFCMSSCGGNSSEKQASAWLEQARQCAGKGDYAGSMAAIDSLRKKHPDAIEARKVALKLYQEVNLKAAQLAVEQADKALQAAIGEYERMKAEVEEHKVKGIATADELTRLTRQRMKRDSLQTVVDVQCAKIKYIRAKMKEQ